MGAPHHLAGLPLLLSLRFFFYNKNVHSKFVKCCVFLSVVFLCLHIKNVFTHGMYVCIMYACI